MKPWTNCFSASSPPDTSRLRARSHIMSKARLHMPMVRMAWWMRPPPRRVWAMAKAWPSPPSSASSGTRTSS